MNIIEALQVWRYDLPYGTGGKSEYIEAAQIIENFLARYDALAPTPEMWEQAPSWTQWYAIDADGDGRYREKEPTIFIEEGRWYGIALEGHIDNMLPHNMLPLGIDWRLCKWQRPEVTG